MKKFLASALMLLAASTATFAQHAVGSFTLQPKVGLNIASLTKNDGGDPRYGVAGSILSRVLRMAMLLTSSTM